MDIEDYRNSHKSKGGAYDGTISSSPFDAYMDKWEEHHLAQTLRRLFPTTLPRYLDFACGTGRITKRVALHASESYGVDVSETMLESARAKCRSTRFICADLTKDMVDLGVFDLVTAFRFFGNAQHELRAAALLAISRHLRNGGYLIINNHRNPGSLLGAWRRLAGGAHEMDLSYFKLKSLLERHGFEIVYQRAIGFWLFRFKLTAARWLESATATRLERAFQHSFFAPFSPDAILVARKIAR